MRTRFLNTDYFASSSFETPAFFKLPVPDLSSSLAIDFDQRFLQAVSLVDNSLQIQQLPIGSALSKFFSDVFPQATDFNYRDLELDDGCVDDRSKFASSHGPETTSKGNMVPEEQKKNKNPGDDAYDVNVVIADPTIKQGFKAIEFETPELDPFLDSAYTHEEDMKIFLDVSEMEYGLDELNKGLLMQYSCEIPGSGFLVEDASSRYDVEPSVLVSEDGNHSGDRVLAQLNTYPVLEIDEVCPGVGGLSPEDVFVSVLEGKLWTKEVELLIDGKELLGVAEKGLMEFLLDKCLSKQFPKPEISFEDLFVDLDTVSMVELPQSGSTFDQLQCDEFFNWGKILITFEEFQLFSEEPSQLFEDILNRPMMSELEQCDNMFREELNFKSFDELIVSHELVPVNGTFKSLPVPVLSDQRSIVSLYDIVEGFLSELKQLSFSASDGIYLDWYILEASKNCSETNFFLLSKVNEIECCIIDFEWEPLEDRMLVYDFIFNDGASSSSVTERHENSPSSSCDEYSLLHAHPVGLSSGGFPETGHSKCRTSEVLLGNVGRKASLLETSMSFNDLDFYLNPRTTLPAENAVLEDSVTNLRAKLPAVQSVVSSRDQLPVCSQMEWDIRFYNVKLSDDIAALIADFEKTYLTILSNETDLNALLSADNFKLTSLPKKNLIDCIKRKLSRRRSSDGDEEIMAFVALCAIKQTVWYTCFYGIHIAYLYLERLCETLRNLRLRLHFLHSLLTFAHEKVIEEITSSHPSLGVIQGILQSNRTQDTSKILILADQLLWCSLKVLLVSMGLSCNELRLDRNADQAEASLLDTALVSDCLLVSHQDVSTCFPFGKFNLILEYGGPRKSSGISSLSPIKNLAGSPCLHVINVALDDSSTSKAFCEGVDMPPNIKSARAWDSIQAVEADLSEQHLEELLNFVPFEDNFKNMNAGAGNDAGHCVPVHNSLFPLAGDSENTQKRMVGTIIIVNTQNLDKEMIISRRSTYQKILAIEKEGAQVLERDSDLPVDIIVSSSVCLVWYDCRSIGEKASASPKAPFVSSFCVENIATNILTSLSFAFSGCFMVFEGETSFFSMIMEFSDGLYSAAASLGIDLQLLYSCSSDTTDDIILNCINYAAKFSPCLFPKMPESETLAESFLTKFASINPLAAHAILSSAELLIQFLEWSPERRIRAVKEFLVPEECVFLFSALCKYGEKEDSKSILTDCSSSVSSGAESDKYCMDADYGRKRQRNSNGTPTIDLNMDDCLYFEPTDKSTDNIPIPSRILDIYDPPLSAAPGALRGRKKPTSYSANYADLEDNFNFSGMLNQFKVPEEDGSLVNKSILGDDQWQNFNSSWSWHEDLRGEVINIQDGHSLGEDFPSTVDLRNQSFLASDEQSDLSKKSRIPGGLSVNKSSALSFPTSFQINSSSYSFPNARRLRESFQGTHHVIGRGYTSNSGQVNLFENPADDGETPLAKAIHRAEHQSGSPWTLEFLNRIREKSRLRQQSLPPVTSSPCPGMPLNTSRVRKRRSPSILEFFKYKGGVTPSPRKTTESKKQKKNVLQFTSSSKIEKASDHLLIGTPLDKRARQRLSFQVGGSGSQSKLIWDDGDAHGLSKKFRNQ